MLRVGMKSATSRGRTASRDVSPKANTSVAGWRSYAPRGPAGDVSSDTHVKCSDCAEFVLKDAR
jgi:hypothetical protein